MAENERITRRTSLLRLGGLAAGLAGVAAWRAGSSPATAGSRALASGAVECVLMPELTEGPYYVSGERLRHDITAGKPGAPLLLAVTVLDAAACSPLAGAAVDVWHCDAVGVYSGTIANNPGTNFLRGVQRTNAKGLATFRTIYPGWYPGRAVHIHLKVHVGGSVVHTGQLFFPAAVTNAVYRKQPYRSHGTRPDTTNAADAIYQNGGARGMLTLRRHGAGWIGSVVTGVHTA
jgi:protocatechuate 3,4-dioxygenase beta subunit